MEIWNNRPVTPLRLTGILLTVIAGVSCHATAPRALKVPTIQPGAPGAPSRVVDSARAADLSSIRPTRADVQFMQEMIHHHAQALDMTRLLSTNSRRTDMKMLALRIELSQSDEIKMMQRWLEVRGEEVPGEHAHHAPGAKLMPGMLTPDEMDRLGQARDETFDRLFLEFMIKHHLGALTMVDGLMETAGAAQDSDIFAFTSDVVADQRAEIDRMGSMLKELAK